MLKGIVFDFDGVILETIDVKKEAFRKLFADSEYVDDIVKYHMENGGLSRYRKFEYIYKNFLQKTLSAEQSSELGKMFRDYALAGVLKAEFVDGALEFLGKHHKLLNLFVASGTPHEEMIEVVERRDLKSYFRQVFGSPATKAEILTGIMSKYGLLATELIFVGDALTDYYGAAEAGVPFVGRINPDYGNPFEGLKVTALIKDLKELDQYVLRNYTLVR